MAEKYTNRVLDQSSQVFLPYMTFGFVHLYFAQKKNIRSLSQGGWWEIQYIDRYPKVSGKIE